jgi:guanylate kinase
LVILSGPSGAGKSTVVRELIRNCELPLVLSVSATTRAPRAGEVDGRDYHFLSRDEFARRREADEFLECKEVFGQGDWYGTLRQVVDEGLQAGKWVILEIDVQGALSVMEQRPSTISLFVHPGSLDELEKRLRRRGTDTEQSIARRLQVAADEMTFVKQYDFEVINHEVSKTVQTICQLLKQSVSQGSKHNA